MADIYRITYSQKHPAELVAVLASATTPENAIAAAKAADSRYKETTSVTKVFATANILVGS